MYKPNLAEAYQDFINHLPDSGDVVLLILKGHLLIEKQVDLLIQNRLPKPDALKLDDLTAHQKICLANALVSDTRGSVDSWLWPAVIKLNKLRNDIAHKLSASGIEDRMTHLAELASQTTNPKDIRGDFESTLLTIYIEIHHRIEELNMSDFVSN